MSGSILQQQLESEVKEFRNFQKQITILENSRAQYLTQQNENELVLKELELLEEEAEVYKLIGPALLRQQKQEAISNVNKRIEFIGCELKKIEDTSSDLEKKQAEKRNKIMTLQQQLQAQTQKAK